MFECIYIKKIVQKLQRLQELVLYAVSPLKTLGTSIRRKALSRAKMKYSV